MAGRGGASGEVLGAPLASRGAGRILHPGERASRAPRPPAGASAVTESALTQDIVIYAAIGFLAQLVDGAIGMAYGLTATSVMMAQGVPPAAASAAVHAAEVATTGLSGLAHWRLGHVVPRLVRRLAVPGMLGGVAGALLAGHLPMAIVKPVVNLYLLAMGLVILRRAWLGRPAKAKARAADPAPLGFGGGFLDAVGGGGWGPIVTSTLIGRGMDPKVAIGSSNAAEFFVTAAVTGAFLTAVGIAIWPIVLGLVIGGAVAAPFAALATRQMPARPLMGIVGAVIVLLAGTALLRQVGLLG